MIEPINIDPKFINTIKTFKKRKFILPEAKRQSIHLYFGLKTIKAFN